MKLKEAIATADALFVKPLLWAKPSKDDKKVADSIKDLEKVEVPEEKPEKNVNQRFYQKHNKKLYRRFRIRG